MRAHIAWPDGAASAGWGRDADLATARLKAAAEAIERHACSRLPASAWFAAGRWWLPACTSEGRRTAVLADCACLPRAFPRGYRLLGEATSSGCASGSTLAEAIQRGALELVERDAFMRHWFAQRPGRALAENSLPGSLSAALATLRRRGCEAGLQCLTLGRRPVLLAWARHARRGFTCIGTACALQAEAAGLAAMQEMETIALARLEGLPAERIDPHAVRLPADHGALYADPRWFDRADDVLLRAEGTPLPWPQLQQACAAGGCPPLQWVDLSLPDAENFLEGAPLYTVRVLAPGLVPIAFGPRQPYAMVDRVAPGGRFPHPFT